MAQGLVNALPTGAATSAKQDTGNTSVASIDTKTPSLGQAVAASSVPVILPSATITTLTPPAAITGFALESGGNLATLAGAITSSILQSNVKQINGVTPLMGSGIMGTGSLRVTIASDNDALIVKQSTASNLKVAATLDAETTKVIGTINLASAQTLATVTTVSTVTNLSQMGGVAIALNTGAVSTGTQRVVEANDTGRTLVSKGGSAGSSGDNTLVAAGTNKLKVYAFSLSTVSTTAVTAIFQSGASGTELWRVVLQTPASVAGGANLTIQPPAWIFATASATLLNLNLSAAVMVHWSVSYFDEA